MTSVLQPGIAEITNQLEFDDDVAFQATRKIYDHARFDADKPLALMASFTHPHDPYAARKQFWDLYKDEDIDLPAYATHANATSSIRTASGSTMSRPWMTTRSPKPICGPPGMAIMPTSPMWIRSGWQAARHAGNDRHAGQHHCGVHIRPW